MSEVYEEFWVFQTYVERQTGKSIAVLWSDSGTEYVNAEMDKCLVSKGIQHQKSISYTPKQMDIAEHNSLTLQLQVWSFVWNGVEISKT